MDVRARLGELQNQGLSLDEAIKQIFKEDYDTSVKELVHLTEKDAYYIGRLKAVIGKEHAKGVTPQREASKVQAKESAPPREPVKSREMTPPIVTEFKAAIDDLLEKSSPRFREHLSLLSERQADKLVRNHDAFENFLSRNGLTPVQTNGVIERILVTTGQQPPGQGIVRTVQMLGGGFFHILQPKQP